MLRNTHLFKQHDFFQPKGNGVQGVRGVIFKETTDRLHCTSYPMNVQGF